MLPYRPKQTDTARVMRARVGSDVIADARDVAHLAAACIPLVEPLWSREDAPLAAWLMVVDHVEYVEENGDQFIRTPWSTLEGGRGDCKSTAILIACLCAACGCDVALRFIVHPGERDYGHVFAIVDGIAVDPLLNFGEQYPNAHAEDVALSF